MRIYDGRDSFYQWDSNQKVVHNFKVGDEVHFFNMKQPTALTVKAYQLNNEVVADVPNILLQSSYPIYIYWMNLDEDCQFTKEEFTFSVNQRAKPSGYVYTETEVLSYEYLDARISKLEDNSDENNGSNTDHTNCVKTVNGISPDANGNVEIEVSGGNANCLLTIETITIGEPGEPGNIPVTGITLDYSTISLDVGDSMMLAASVSPSDATNNAVLWESSNTDVARVNNGLVTAVDSGNCTITAKSAENNSITATCEVSVASASGETKVLLSSLDMQSGLMKKDGVTIYNTDSAYHVEIPYYEGMTISTGLNKSWIVNYPPFIVSENGTITVPEYETGESFTTGNKYPCHYQVTLNGYSEDATVYVNIYAAGSIDGSVSIVETMNSSDKFWYTYEA